MLSAISNTKLKHINYIKHMEALCANLRHPSLDSEPSFISNLQLCIQYLHMYHQCTALDTCKPVFRHCQYMFHHFCMDLAHSCLLLGKENSMYYCVTICIMCLYGVVVVVYSMVFRRSVVNCFCYIYSQERCTGMMWGHVYCFVLYGWFVNLLKTV